MHEKYGKVRALQIDRQLYIHLEGLLSILRCQLVSTSAKVLLQIWRLGKMFLKAAYLYPLNADHSLAGRGWYMQFVERWLSMREIGDSESLPKQNKWIKQEVVVPLVMQFTISMWYSYTFNTILELNTFTSNVIWIDDSVRQIVQHRQVQLILDFPFEMYDSCLNANK